MSITSIGSNPTFNPSNNNEHVANNGILHLGTGNTISVTHLKDVEKTGPDLCWISSESHFIPEEFTKDMIGTDSFVSDKQKDNLTTLTQDNLDEDDVFFDDDESEDLVDDYELTMKIEVEQKTEAKETEQTTMELAKAKEQATTTLAKTVEQTGSQSAKNNLKGLLEDKLKSLGCVYESASLFDEDANKLWEEINNSPTKKDELVLNFIDNAINQDKVGHTVKGQFVPLNQEEKEKLREELKSFFLDYFARFPILETKKPEEELVEKDHLDHDSTFIIDPKNYTVAIYHPNRPIFSDDSQVQFIIKISILAQSILLENIVKKGQEEASERREQAKVDQLIQIIFADILKTEILKNEIQTQNIKLEITAKINVPMRVKVKLISIIKNSNKANIEIATLQLPGLHKMVPSMAKATG